MTGEINYSIFQLLSHLWSHINPRRRLQLSLLLVLMVFASFSEILTIGAVFPFLAVLTAPEAVFSHSVIQPFVRILGLTDPLQLVLPLSVLFCGIVVIACGMRLALLWFNIRLSFSTGADLGISIYRKTLYQSYIVHCSRNSSEIISAISNKVNNVIHCTILPLLTIISSSIMLLSITVSLILIEPRMTLVAFVGVGLIYFVIIRRARQQLFINGQCIARESVQIIKLLQEGLGGIRDILIDGNQAVYCQIYRDADVALRRAQGDSAFMSGSPRYGIEAVAMLLIVLVAYMLIQQPGGIARAIPMLGMFALGAQRLLPVLQQFYAAWANIVSGQAILQDVLELLDQPMPSFPENMSIEPLSFKSDIRLQQLGFRYTLQSPFVLKKINLTITKGCRMGFIGGTGSGKSTLLDIIMGLLHPTVGELLIDGHPLKIDIHRAWQSHIAHVPQAIFLADSTIEENIAFGIPKEKIDFLRVQQAARQAQIAETIENWPNRYKTVVGERGVRLSGGQRQRIGIARALYKQASVIIFDEATSALDSKTEHAVMQAIDGLSSELTIIIVAHRLSTLKNCTQIVELEDGNIKRIGNYKDICAN